MSNYESLFISTPNLAPDVLDRLVKFFEDLIEEHGGKLNNTIRWGRRQLAYEIENYREGVYTIFEFEGGGELVKELERRYRLNDSVLRFLTVRTDRKQKLMKKGAAKRQAKQEAKQRRTAKSSADK